MVWLLGYLSIGIAVLGGIFIESRIRNAHEASEFSNLVDNVRRNNRSWREYIIEDILLSAFTVTAVIAAWPIALIFTVYFYYKKPDSVPHSKDRMPSVFTVTTEDLLRPKAVAQIEVHEVIYDPRGGVPNVPFGHFNKSWKAFLKASQPEDALWSFAAPWEQYGKKEQRHGYARVSNGEVINWFTKSIKPVSSSISSS